MFSLLLWNEHRNGYISFFERLAVGLADTLGWILEVGVTDVAVTEGLPVLADSEGGNDDASELFEELVEFFEVDGFVKVFDEDISFVVLEFVFWENGVNHKKVHS